MSTFNVGDRVRSTVNAQGLVAGVEYEVLDVRTRRTFVGGFTTYYLRCLDRTVAPTREDGTERALAVGNGHLVLEAV
jgi:hypothetical protein